MNERTTDFLLLILFWIVSGSIAASFGWIIGTILGRIYRVFFV